VAATTPETYLSDLNPAQREAVLTTEGAVLVIAGAGSGKTRVLTRRIAHLLNAAGAKPPEILAITFTNKAAAEMRERVEHLVGPPARAAWVMTFHAACGRILRREAPRLGYRTNFTIYDSADQLRLTKQCLEELDRDPKRFTPRGIHSQISNAKNQLIGPAEYASRVSSFYDQTVADVYELYQKKLLASNAVDFDDMLYLTVDVLERFPEAQEKWQKAFRYVLVDEYQDTNHAQYKFLQVLAATHGNVFAVGDPDQSIYAFGGALRRGGDRDARRAGVLRQRDRRVLPDECAEPGARGRARAPGDRLPSDRRAALLRARGGQGSRRLSPSGRQSVRRGIAAASREPAASRDRRLDARQADVVRRRRGDVAVGGDGPLPGGRRRHGACEGCRLVPDDHPVADVRHAGAGGSGADRAGARAERVHRVARGRADDRVAGADREPAGARGARARVGRKRGRADALGIPAGGVALLRPGCD